MLVVLIEIMIMILVVMAIMSILRILLSISIIVRNVLLAMSRCMPLFGTEDHRTLRTDRNTAYIRMSIYMDSKQVYRKIR